MTPLNYLIKQLVMFMGYLYIGAPTARNLFGAREAVMVAEADRWLKTLHSIAYTQCGLICTDPMPTPANLAEYHTNAHCADYQLAFASGMSRHHFNCAAREAAFRTDFLARMLRLGHVQPKDLTARVNSCLFIGFSDPRLVGESHPPEFPAAAVRT